jgi:hypothetical protein
MMLEPAQGVRRIHDAAEFRVSILRFPAGHAVWPVSRGGVE